MKGWVDNEVNPQDIIINSSVSLLRNFSDVKFTNKLSEFEAKENINKVSSALDNNFKLICLWEENKNDIENYLNEDIISKKLSKRDNIGAVLYNDSFNTSIMINEEDHLNIKCTLAGLNLKEEYRYVNRIDDIIENKITYAFHERFGYITVSPDNIGTGLKASVVIHLPALNYTKKIEDLSKSLCRDGFIIESIYDDKKIISNMFRLSTKISIGLHEEDIIDKFDMSIFKIINDEKQMRVDLFTKYKSEIEDRIFRSYAILKNAIMISEKEVIELLSDVRLGIEMSLINEDKKKINQILIRTSRKFINNDGYELSVRDQNIERAKMIKEILG